MVTHSQNRQKLVFLRICAPPDILCNFSHVSNDSRLTLTQTRSSSFGVSAVAMVTTPRDVAAAPQTPQLGGGPGQLWGPKLV